MSEVLNLPGFIDVHVHLREPSDNKAETISSGTEAALLGGYAHIADMPNNPGNPTWTEGRIDEKIQIAQRDAFIPVSFYAGAQPESDNIGELEKMAPKAIGLKLYGAPTTGNDKDYEAADFESIVKEWDRVAPNKPIMLHAGKDNLEDMIDLVTGIGHRLHVCHVNSPEEVETVMQAKSESISGLPLTCGVCPHHLFKTSHDVKTEGWFARMQPPLAKQTDSEKLFSLLNDRSIDIIESDFAPHSKDSKMHAEEENPEGIHDPHHATCFGVPGIEHIVPILLRQLKIKNLSYDTLLDTMYHQPAAILGLKKSVLTTFSWEMTDFRIESESNLASGAKWTPYLGKLATGKLVSAAIGGRNVFNTYKGAQKYAHSTVTERY